MRIIQFRRYLSGFIISVTDPKDIRTLSSRKDFERFSVIREKLKDGNKIRYNLINAEFYYSSHRVTTGNAMRVFLRKVLKPRIKCSR